jgi:hypothetical protein
LLPCFIPSSKRLAEFTRPGIDPSTGTQGLKIVLKTGLIDTVTAGLNKTSADSIF